MTADIAFVQEFSCIFFVLFCLFPSPTDKWNSKLLPNFWLAVYLYLLRYTVIWVDGCACMHVSCRHSVFMSLSCMWHFMCENTFRLIYECNITCVCVCVSQWHAPVIWSWLCWMCWSHWATRSWLNTSWRGLASDSTRSHPTSASRRRTRVASTSPPLYVTRFHSYKHVPQQGRRCHPAQHRITFLGIMLTIWK